ncbi:eukaryotic translation initiation factor 4B [Stomoxys calcitrans]|uniref:RRM domain-containing protein n=1 Tax=Stomoxys calcitrans TaxID=35570 RepID=A0A1I8Q356_STOCA|nr:eukaryotic translation initiation factor 4B [Stomoxys calcitrans]
MASSGKKGKKAKGTVLSLQTFLSNGETPPLGTTQVAKNVRNIDGDDSDDDDKVLTLVCNLPTAPRANRAFDENHVPYKAPFIAYVTNLPFDITEEDVYTFFNNNNIVSVRLPREDGETGRVRGFGYIEFETRDGLIHALGLPDPSIKGRRIRIELSNESDQSSRQRGNRRNYEMPSNSENRESTNWRRDNIKKEVNNIEYDRGDQTYSHGETSWRSRQRPKEMHGKMMMENKDDLLLERPRLNLKPRTLPLPENDKPMNRNEPLSSEKLNTPSKLSGACSEKIFGSAKPVDTTARDLEIEQRIDIRRQETLQKVIDVSIGNIHNENTESVESNWRKSNVKLENQQQDLQKKDYGRDNSMDKRSARYNNSKDSYGELKQKDVSKGKSVRPVPRQSPKQQDTVVVSSNKYSGLDEDSD